MAQRGGTRKRDRTEKTGSRRRLVRGKRILFVPFVGVAWVLLMASVAWACVTFQGKFQVDAPRGSSVSFGSGYHPDSGGQADIEYCKPGSGKATGHQGQANQIRVSFAPYGGCQWVNAPDTESKTDGAKADVGAYDVRVDTRRTFCDLREPNCPPEGLTAPPGWDNTQSGWFRMSLGPDGQPVTDTSHRGTQCFFPPDRPSFKKLVASGDIVVLGKMMVNDKGQGSGTFTIPEGAFNGPTDAASICTRERGASQAEWGHVGPPHSSQNPIIIM